MTKPSPAVDRALGHQIRDLRLAKGITIPQLAQRIERSVGWVSQIERGLHEAGFAVDVVHNALDAKWMAAAVNFDAIVLDVGLPDGDGFELCSDLRAREEWTPILMLTARDSVADRVRGLDVGADDYLVKPFAFPELVARLRGLMRRCAPPRPTVLVTFQSTAPATFSTKNRWIGVVCCFEQRRSCRSGTLRGF